MIKSVFTILVYLGISATLIAQTDVFDAARKGDVKSMEHMYTMNEDTINANNKQGYTPLILACYYNQTEVLKFLISKKVILNEKPNSPTALQAASYKGFTKGAEMLLNYGANPNIADANGTSPLIYAVQFNHKEITELLIKKGADVNYKDPSGFSALDYATQLNVADIVKLFNKN
jgi:ankyrin repeat protein